MLVEALEERLVLRFVPVFLVDVIRIRVIMSELDVGTRLRARSGLDRKPEISRQW
jgi:hypothetical protein